ncbi:MAG: M3 family oligoendopeptidase [Fibrobacteria bacterium]|nr:M3 family oligoendopeptidase [Fibrobacteria bacterium]
MLDVASAQTAAQDSAKGVRWDLSSLYTGPDDPVLDGDFKAAEAAVDRFTANWKGKTTHLDPEQAGRMLEEFESATEIQWRIGSWTSLAYSIDSQNPSIMAVQARARKLFSDLEARTSFLTVEISTLEDSQVETWWSDERASRLRRWVEELRKYRKHILSEPEERLASRKDLTGKSATAQLFDDLTNSLTFPFDDGSGLRDRTGAEMLAFGRNPDPALRKAAHEAFLGVYARNGLVLSHVFNTLCQDHEIDMEVRGYSHPMQRTHMNNSLPDETVETMMRVVRESYPIAQRFWKAKAKLLGMEKLANTDLYAPISTRERPLPWPEAVETVLSAYDTFSPELGNLARRFHENGWIDAEVRPGKEDGAFCSGSWPSHHPYVLMNYTGLLRDVYTLAHELGHGVHYSLSSRQPLFLYDAPLVLAETASIFGEQLLTLKLLESEQDPELRRALLCSRIEDAISTAYRQNVLTEFELSAHLGRKDGLLSQEKLCDLWWKANADLYGDAVAMNSAYRWGWSYIPHFIHTRFYCYAYTFGLLLVLGLYQRWREEGEDFVPRYLELLSKGGSEDPAKACEAVGIRLDEDFWRAGNRAIESLVAEFESLV